MNTKQRVVFFISFVAVMSSAYKFYRHFTIFSLTNEIFQSIFRHSHSFTRFWHYHLNQYENMELSNKKYQLNFFFSFVQCYGNFKSTHLIIFIFLIGIFLLPYFGHQEKFKREFQIRISQLKLRKKEKKLRRDLSLFSSGKYDWKYNSTGREQCSTPANETLLLKESPSY